MPQRSYPLAREGRINGRPFQGAHTIKNADGTFQWQSCRAFDLNRPIGTPVRVRERRAARRGRGRA